MSKDSGVLYIVATPIGNLQDMTDRAITVLSQVDCVAAEDTRHSKRLLQHFGVDTPLMSLHEHNERQAAAKVIARIEKGQDLALISDAGTPLISDPGFPLVRDCRRLGIQVVPVPGPSALIAALSVSGLPTDRFRFEGFLPRTFQTRQRKLEKLQQESATLVFYEASHRILHALEDLVKVMGGERQACVARELTKQYEEILHGTLDELAGMVAAESNRQKGEFVIVVAGRQESEASEQVAADLHRLLEVLVQELPVSQAAAIAARISGQKKNRLYQMALEMKAQQKPGIS